MKREQKSNHGNNMSRVEKDDQTQELKKPAKKEMANEIRRNRKKFHSFFSCFFLVIFVVCVFGGWITWSVALTGLLDIPIVSPLAFKSVKPVRLVLPDTPVEELIPNTIKTAIINRYQIGANVLGDRNIRLVLPERSLTASLQTLVKNSGLDFLDRLGSQIAIIPEKKIEIFLPLKNSKQSTSILAEVKVEIINNEIQFIVDSVYVGRLRIPTFLITRLIQPYVNQQTETLNKSLKIFLSLDRVLYEKNDIVLTGSFTTDVK